MVIHDLMDGRRLYNVVLKALHKAIMIKNPKKMPKLNDRLFLNPYLVALDIDIMLLGQGVKVVIRT